MEELSPEQRDNLSISLKNIGFELLDDKKTITVEKIKTIVIELIHHNEDQIKTNLSDYLSEKLNHNYTYLSNLFPKSKGLLLSSFTFGIKLKG